jgi:hypothetical protein
MMIGLRFVALLPVPVPVAALVVVVLLLLDPQPATTIAEAASALSAAVHALILLIESPFRCARDPLGWRPERSRSGLAPRSWVVLP